MTKEWKMENGKWKMENRFLYFAFCILHFAFFSVLPASAQKIAFLVPEKNPVSLEVNEKFRESLAREFKILDDSLAESAAQGFTEKNVFNLSTQEARNLGRAMGSDFFILLKAETLRRASLSKPSPYYESYAAVYLVSSRTGRLAFWKLASFEAAESAEAEKKLHASIESLAAEVSAQIESAAQKELAEDEPPRLAEPPAEDSPEAKNFRAPLPFRRLRPAYPPEANLYGVAATIDALVDLDETGRVLRVEITRWAGYGLDESVIETIRKMQWRAASYLAPGGEKPLPIRILLRYNFKKLKTDDDEQ
jgi:hypothetical protein